MLNPLEHPVCLAEPRWMTPGSAWHGHIPFAMYLVSALRPRLIVELEVHAGDSYCAFCQAVDELGLGTQCYGIDTWRGDPHSGFYGPEVLTTLRKHHDPHYGTFSRLLVGSFDDHLDRFSSGSVDILHIDGYHTYEAVKGDLTAWLPKVSERGVVLLHDTNVRQGDFGVWRLWKEVVRVYPHFEFVHSAGLGILGVGSQLPEHLCCLLEASPTEADAIRRFFFLLGARLDLRMEVEALKAHTREPMGIRIVGALKAFLVRATCRTKGDGPSGSG